MCYVASEQADVTDVELSKLFSIGLLVCQECLTGEAKMMVKTAIRNAKQRASRVTIAAQRKAKRDAQSMRQEVYMMSNPMTFKRKSITSKITSGPKRK